MGGGGRPHKLPRHLGWAADGHVWGEGIGQEGAGRSSLVGTQKGQPAGLWSGDSPLGRVFVQEPQERRGNSAVGWTGVRERSGDAGRQSSEGPPFATPSLTGPDIVDIKPANMEDLTEVITASEFHPHHCNLFVYSSSKGSLRLCDMRAAALCDKHSKRKCPSMPRLYSN